MSYLAQFKVLVLTPKALSGMELKEQNSAKGISQLAVMCDSAVSVGLSHLWKALPREVLQSPLLLTFRRNSKTFLFTQALDG